MVNNSEYLAIFVRFLGDRALPFTFAGPIEIATHDTVQIAAKRSYCAS